MTRVLLLALLLLATQASVAESDLDAELDAEWGHKRTQATTAETPENQYAAGLKLIEKARDSKKSHCQRERYCVKLAEEQFRRNKRALDARFEGHTNDDDFNRRKNLGFK
ncbi:MAG: hypothetical protein EXR86_05975 [Gammaproteobacteria bacterium]|nr:hypothetical protein [Gammaproteobacteria bacterium]